LTIQRTAFAPPTAIADEVARAVDYLRADGKQIDYLTFVPDGEPTLDTTIGKAIRLLRPLGIRVAVITNGSLLWMGGVREDLSQADWVSLKIDTVDAPTWHLLNRPHGRLDLSLILEGLTVFGKEFVGTLTTETMLVRGINDGEALVARTAAFVSALSPGVSYLSIPLRPPAEPWVVPPDNESLIMAYEIFLNAGVRVELLSAEEPDTFTPMRNAEQDILNAVMVHPMREESLQQLVEIAGADGSIVPRLLSEGRLRAVIYNGRKYFVPGDRQARRRG
jgi:wyosine [tRNA(Phe)-imidazoG37] synthetase (radical SAM superfamily)